MGNRQTGIILTRTYEAQVITCDQCGKDMSHPEGYFFYPYITIAVSFDEDSEESKTFHSVECATAYLNTCL